MNIYTNKIEINGIIHTHTIEAENVREAYSINEKRKITAKCFGRRIFGHLIKAC